MEPGFIAVRVAVLLVTNEHTAMDESTVKYVIERLTGEGHRLFESQVLKDSQQLVKAQLLRWFADPDVDVVLAVAGIDTESTRAALAPLVTKQIEGFTDLFRMLTYNEIGTGAMLVDVTAAQCGSTFVFVLPASQGAVKTAIDKLLIPQLDARTKPRNLVMRMTKRRSLPTSAKPARPNQPAELDERDLAAVPVPVKTETTAVGVPPPPARRATPPSPPARRPPTPPPVASFDGRAPPPPPIASFDGRTPPPPPPRRPPTPPPVASFDNRTPPPPPPRRPPTPPPVTAPDVARIPLGTLAAHAPSGPAKVATPATGVAVTKPATPATGVAVTKPATPATGVAITTPATPVAAGDSAANGSSRRVANASAPSTPAGEQPAARPAGSTGTRASTVKSEPDVTSNAADAPAVDAAAGDAGAVASGASPASTASPVASGDDAPAADDAKPVEVDAGVDVSKPNSVVPITPFSALKKPASDDPRMASSSVVVDDDELNATIDHVAVAGSVKASNKMRPAPIVEDAVILDSDLEALVERGAPSTGTEPLPIAATEPMFDARELAKPRERRRKRLAVMLLGTIALLGGGGVLAFNAMSGPAEPRIAPIPPVPKPPPPPPPVVAPDAAEPAPVAPVESPVETPSTIDAAAPPPVDNGSDAPKPRKTPNPETPRPETPKPETPAPETPAPETPAPDTVKSPDNPKPAGECDEVSCILEKYGRPCCARWKPAPAPKPTPSGIPEELDATMIKAGVNTMRPVIIRCGERSSVKGTVKVAVTVAADGHVDSVSVASAPDPDLGECVAAALRKTSFARTRSGGSFNYPFVF